MQLVSFRYKWAITETRLLDRKWHRSTRDCSLLNTSNRQKIIYSLCISVHWLVVYERHVMRVNKQSASMCITQTTSTCCLNTRIMILVVYCGNTHKWCKYKCNYAVCFLMSHNISSWCHELRNAWYHFFTHEALGSRYFSIIHQRWKCSFRLERNKIREINL